MVLVLRPDEGFFVIDVLKTVVKDVLNYYWRGEEQKLYHSYVTLVDKVLYLKIFQEGIDYRHCSVLDCRNGKRGDVFGKQRTD